MRVYEELQALGGIPFLSCEVSRRRPSESCLGTPSVPSYEHIYKNIQFGKGKGRERKGREGQLARQEKNGKRRHEAGKVFLIGLA